MAEVMNRAASRAAGGHKVNIEVTNRIDVVSMQHVETYFTHEIESEGKWKSGSHVIQVQPEIDRGRVDGGWFRRMLERMRETRERKGTIPLKVGLDSERDIAVDAGLVNVTVFFRLPEDQAIAVLKNREIMDRFSTENFRHFDAVCAGALHDQMIILVVPHYFHSDGSPLLHFHNLILGLRQEVRGDMDILEPLDLSPLLKTLAKSGPVSFLGGMRQ